MSRGSAASEVIGDAPGHDGTGDARERTKAQESRENSDESSPSATRRKQANEQGNARSAPGGVRGKGKQNDKQNDKRAEADPKLLRVIDAWPDLPDPIRTAILAIVQSATEPKGQPARKRKE